jgi:hypothetical protein
LEEDQLVQEHQFVHHQELQYNVKDHLNHESILKVVVD